jgi:4-hydroxythreonine-4-phosphate dehydrogenase
MGEPAGVGPDLILQIYAERHQRELPPFIVYGQLEFLRSRAERLGLDLPMVEASPAEAPDSFAEALPVCSVDGLVPDKPGEASPLSGKVVIGAIAQSVTCALNGACRGVVTGPIHKHALYAAGFKHPGHTEFLAELCGTPGAEPLLPVMMLCHEELRVVPATIHVPLRAVPDLVTVDLLVATGEVLAHDLRTRFGIAAPRIAMAGFNPHASEGGAIGREDFDVVGPAITELRFRGHDVEGPIPADTLFYPPHWRRFDAVIAMYHDQAMIPIKTVAFEGAVNVTLGLPIVRTSPDHGTAFDLAGTGRASSASMLAAIRLADWLTGGAVAARQAAQ